MFIRLATEPYRSLFEIVLYHWPQELMSAYEREERHQRGQDHSCPRRSLLLHTQKCLCLNRFGIDDDDDDDDDDDVLNMHQVKVSSMTSCHTFSIVFPTPLFSFRLFSFFSITILFKNCWLQRDSNSDLWSRSWIRLLLDHHHGPNIQ